MNSSKSISAMNDITQSDFKIPLAASSPADEVSVSTINSNIKELTESLEASREKLKESVKKFFEEKKSELNKAVHKFSSSGNYDQFVTANHLKVLQKRFKNFNIESTTKNGASCDSETRNGTVHANETKNSTVRGKKAKPTNSTSKLEPSLILIEEENDDEQEKKKLKFAVASEEDDALTFKKPADRSKRPTRTTKISNSFRTPKNLHNRGYNVAVVTPGPNSQKPISILRRPNPGEMAISMTGSPLLIAHNNIPVHVPQISIPLSDGRVMTVLANEGLDPDMSICSEIDADTQERLAVLQELLAKKTRKVRK